MIRTRRQLLQAATVWPASLALGARKEFWESKDSASWTDDEKEILLSESPWAMVGVARMEVDKNRRPSQGYGNDGRPAGGMPDMRPGVPPGGMKSVPIGEKIPPPPKPDSGQHVEFPVLARWESAKPVRLAGGPDVPEMTGQFYVIRLRGLPLMPPPKVKPGEPATDPNEHLLAAIKANSVLERKDKRGIRCDHLFTGSGKASTEVLLFFPRGADPITVADKSVTLESRFAVFHVSIRFPLKEMVYRGELAL